MASVLIESALFSGSQQGLNNNIKMSKVIYNTLGQEAFIHKPHIFPNVLTATCLKINTRQLSKVEWAPSDSQNLGLKPEPKINWENAGMLTNFWFDY